MYEAFYGFKEKPFSMLPDPGFLYLSKKHQAALTLLEYGLLNHIGFCVISGEAGAGKTTILRALLERVDDDVTVGLITNTHQSFGGLLDWVLSAFDLHQPNLGHVEMHQIFMDFLIEEYANNRTVLLIVDEAQNMKPDALEELRMLSNVNSEKDQLMQVVLAGQPALKETLRSPELMQFAQRIAVDYHLDALSLKETCGYIQHRLKRAGATRDIFTPAACARIYNYSGGTPRLINLLCETVLVYGFADQKRLIDVDLIEEMVQERMKDSVVPIVNRDTAPPDPASVAELEKDFPSISSDDGSETAPAAGAADSRADTSSVLAAVSGEDRESAATEVVADETGAGADEGAPVGADGSDGVSGDAAVDAQPAPPAKAFQDADKLIFAREDEGDKETRSAGTLKYVIIAVLVALGLIVAALLFNAEGERQAAPAKETHEPTQSAEELARLKRLEEEAAALKRERDAALAKIEAERQAKAEAERLAAEKAEQAAREAAEKRRLQEAEQKRLAALREKERQAKLAAERARKEAEKARREAARLAEEKRQMQLRLEEERRLKAEQEARRLEQERLAEQRRLAAEARARELARQKEQEARKNTSKRADCSGPTARFKSGCR